MIAHRLTPILNVTDIALSFSWFEKLAWTNGWDRGDPPRFGGVCSGTCEIFLCEGAQGGRVSSGSVSRFLRGRRGSSDQFRISPCAS